MTQIVLFTATGAENLGDELITLCEIREFLKEDNHITLFSHNCSRTMRFLLSQEVSLENLEIREYFPNALRQKPLKNIKLMCDTFTALKNADHVYIGGGGLIYGKNDEGHSPLRLWWLRAIFIKFLKKPLTYLSLGISAHAEELKPYARGLFQWTKVTVRDRESRDILQRIGYDGEILPDPVLSYEGEKGENEKKTIGIALRKGFMSDCIIRETIQKIIREGYDVLLLPHSLHPDDESSHDGYYLQKFLLPGVSTTQSIEQTLSAYKKCHIVIAMRLHSMILSVDYGIPFVGISYGKKTESLLKNLAWEYTVGEDISPDKIVQLIHNIENHYIAAQENLSLAHEQYKTQYALGIQKLLGK